MEECQKYFRDKSVYRKLFVKMKGKYASLGHLGGTVVLSKLTMEEKEQLGGFFQKDYVQNKTVSISMTLMKRALEGSRFSSLTWEEILESYFGEPLVVKKDEREREIWEKENYFEHIGMEYAGEKGRQWLTGMLEDKTWGYHILQQQYTQDKTGLKEMLRSLLEAIEMLPAFAKKIQRLAVFAADITGNPHFFDEGTIGGKLLLYFIQSYFGTEEIGESRPEKRNSLLYKAGILNDDLSNYVLTYGLHGKRKDGSTHTGLEGYFNVKEPVQITLFTLQGLSGLWGNERIYVVENPAVFSMLIENNPEISAVCTNGQLRLSVLLLLDMLCKDSIFYYAGDFDPEGLLIAQNLKNRYGEQLCLWNYEKKYYEKTKSEVILSSMRLKKLEKISCEELREIKEALEIEKKAGYQENMDWGWTGDGHNKRRS